MWTAEQTLSLRRPLLILLGRLHTNKHTRTKHSMHILPRNVSEDFQAPSFPEKTYKTIQQKWARIHKFSQTHTHTHCEDKQTEGIKTRPCSRNFTGFFFFLVWLKNFPWHGRVGGGVKKYVAHSEREIKWDSETYRGAGPQKKIKKKRKEMERDKGSW